jgi:hypothetical protein
MNFFILHKTCVDTFLQVFVPDGIHKRDNVERLRKGKEELFSSGMILGKILPPWLTRECTADSRHANFGMVHPYNVCQLPNKGNEGKNAA